MLFPGLQHRFLWRLRAPVGPDEVRRIERWLATGRVFLAVSALFTLWMDSARVNYSPWVYWLLGFYIIHGSLVMLLLRFRQQSTSLFRLLVVHSGDILWPALISTFNTGNATPFFLFFIFVLGAAAYRWGLWETVGTATAAVILLWMESLLFKLGFADWANHLVLSLGLPPLGINVGDFAPRHLLLRSVYLLVMGGLLGYLAEQQKQLRAEKAIVARILAEIRIGSGFTGTLQQIMSELLAMYGAKCAVLASSETTTHRMFVGEMQPSNGTAASFRWLEVSAADHDAFLYDSSAAACFAERESSGSQAFKMTALDTDGTRVRGPASSTLQPISTRYQFSTLASVSFLFGQEWRGRIFLLDASLAGDAEEELRFLQELVRQVGPAVYNVYLLRRLRQRAGAVERARFARELHDGAIQSLIAVEMQVDVLRRRFAVKPDEVPDELGRIQGLLREEVLKLRELMQQMKSLDVDARKILGFMADTAERFQRETGISAHFHSELHELDMPQPVCRELAQIVQEALVNVRKHSRATSVLVQLAARNGAWNLVIEDNGRGFGFAGRFSDDQLPSLSKKPAIIRERVHLIGGQLTIESNPDQGSRLEISIPQRREAAYG